jgi:hypothetical protein
MQQARQEILCADMLQVLWLLPVILQYCTYAATGMAFGLLIFEAVAFTRDSDVLHSSCSQRCWDESSPRSNTSTSPGKRR